MAVLPLYGHRHLRGLRDGLRIRLVVHILQRRSTNIVPSTEPLPSMCNQLPRDWMRDVHKRLSEAGYDHESVYLGNHRDVQRHELVVGE